MSVRQNPFVQEPTAWKRRTPWWLALIVFAVIFVITVIFLQSAVIPAIWPADEGSTSSQFREGFSDLLPILGVFAWLVWYERNRITTLGFHDPRRGVVKIFVGVVIGLCMISVPILLLWATGIYQATTPPPTATSSGFSALPLVLVLVLMVIIQGSSEEVLVRGFMFQRFGLQLPGWLAIVLPALIFTVVHGITPFNAPIAFLTIFGYGLFATFVVLNQKSLWLICGIHAGWNWALGNVYGLAVSGIPPKSNAIFFLEPAPGAADWQTGGQYGTEGSIAAVFMITTATILVFLAWRRSEASQPAIPASTPAATEAR